MSTSHFDAIKNNPDYEPLQAVQLAKHKTSRSLLPATAEQERDKGNFDNAPSIH